MVRLFRPTRWTNKRNYIQSVHGNCLVYATYSADGFLLDDEIYFLDDAIKNKWKVIIVNNGNPMSDLQGRLKAKIINRANESRDLGAFSLVVNSDFKFHGEVIFTNSSIRWSRDSFSRIVKGMYSKQADVIFLTQSRQTFEHGQSYFSWFSKEAVERNAHTVAFGAVRKWKSKRLLVWNEELPVLHRLRINRFDVRFMLTYDDIVREFLESADLEKFYTRSDQREIRKRICHGISLNPTIHFAPFLYKRYGIYKRSLLGNPAQMAESLFFLAPE